MTIFNVIYIKKIKSKVKGKLTSLRVFFLILRGYTRWVNKYLATLVKTVKVSQDRRYNIISLQTGPLVGVWNDA